MREEVTKFIEAYRDSFSQWPECHCRVLFRALRDGGDGR